MPRRPGHNSGQPETPGLFTWEDYLAQLVEAHGSLSAVASRLVEARGYVDDVNSVERGLRRLRTRGNLGGGDYGRRLLSVFGMPQDIDARISWMGKYHSRFSDLPRSFCLEQLRLWNRPPVSESRARIWLQLGLASLALRASDYETAATHLQQAKLVESQAPVAARIELLLVEAFVASRLTPEQVDSTLERVGSLLGEPTLSPEDRACLHARWIDQRAFQLNSSRNGRTPDYAAAVALYEQIATGEVPAFVSCRRENGLAFGRWKLGDRAAAIAHAEASCRFAGDSGSLRFRAMALNMLARVQGGEEGERTRLRALAVAKLLEDEELTLRFNRWARQAAGST